jgi:hypothetical protein
VDMNAAELNRALRAAVADAPPTGIDLDRLIGAEQRRERSLRNAGVICAAALSVLMVTIVFFGLSGRPSTGQRVTGPGPTQPTAGATVRHGSPPCPSMAATGPARPYQSGVSSPRPIRESCGEATARLDDALAGALHTQAPAATFQDVLGSGQPVRFLRANDNNLTYTAGLLLTMPSGRGSLGIQVQPRTYKPPSEAELRSNFGCDRAPASDTTCIYRTEPDGTVVTGVLVPSPMARGGHQYQIQVFRTDDTLVMLMVSNTYYDGKPDPQATPKIGSSQLPLTLDQIITIGRDAGLTLYP